MTTDYFPDDEGIDWRWQLAESNDTYLDSHHHVSDRPGYRLDPIVAVAVILVGIIAIQLLRDRPRPISTFSETSNPLVTRFSAPASRQIAPADAPSIIYPYDNYTLTQGPHGTSYGHMAIDLAAGAGVDIKSPIAGAITALYLDEIGNPTLVIENDIYQVTMLHGDYTVYVGQPVELGQVVGSENNRGYTTDMSGRLCTGRECGHHTHLNIFDKRINANINPLEVLKN